MILNRLQFIGIALAACAACAAAGTWYGYDWGKDAERDRQTTAGVKAYVDIVDRVARVGAAIAEIGRQLRTAIAESHEHERTSTATVTRIVREHPEFAAVRRPAELQRVRRAQLERIARAADAD